MAPNHEDSICGNPILEDHTHEDQNTISANAQDQTLLEALQDLILRVMDPKQTNALNQIHLGPEAGRLIIVLHEFISGIVLRSQSRAQNAIIDVSLNEKEEDILRNDPEEAESDPDDEDDEMCSESASSPDNVSYESDENAIKNNNLGALDISVTLEKPLLTFEEKLQRALREYVFNQMPIRLLCFEPKGSTFRITLLERGAIYGRLASMLEGKTPKGVETDEKAIKRLISKYASFAILSHTWLRTTASEVTYGDWNKELLNSEDLGYRKLVNFCKAAWRDHRVAFGWMDTLCINKESSSELDESIRSMYNWYSRATVCIIYLAETEALENMHFDPWFTRGWTLQELLAPEVIKFYNCHWKQLVESSDNDKEDEEIRNQIERATTISKDELQHIHWTPVSRRMQMAATREVTREEDIAYSLMGIFGISISTAYGEGAERAFLRLLQEIIASSINALDILNWAGGIPFSHLDNTSAILPTSPRCYIQRSSKENLVLWRPIEPLVLSHLGLHVPFILMPGISIRNTELRCDTIGDYTATVDISPVSRRHRYSVPTTFNLLDNKLSGKDGWNVNKQWYQMTFAVFNFTGARNIALLPKTCIALGLMCDDPVGNVSKSGYFDIIRTKRPILFELSKRNASSSDLDNQNFWEIPMDELAKHGMQLISLYL